LKRSNEINRRRKQLLIHRKFLFACIYCNNSYSTRGVSQCHKLKRFVKQINTPSKVSILILILTAVWSFSITFAFDSYN
jgi:hypothetical protein